MPRRPRLHFAGIPVHIVQRGNNRQRCFVDDHDRRDFLRILTERSRHYEVPVHAYVLMDNHVHLLMTEVEGGAVSRVMQTVGMTYVRRFNDRHARSGTLWEGRYHSNAIDSGPYLWNCHRYIEANPVRAGMASVPDAHRWSSFGCNALGRFDPLITPRPEYIALGKNPEERCAAYRSMFDAGLDSEEVDAIRRHLLHERPMGDERFINDCETRSGISARIKPRGRPSLKPA